MHRSGTSAITGILSKLGVHLGDNLLRPSYDNPKGFFENVNILSKNEEILKSIDSSWDDIFFRPDLISSYVIRKWSTEIKAIIENEFKYSPVFAIKDPRLCLLFPIYESVLQNMNVDIKIILSWRNPFEIAYSLKNRDGFSMEKSLTLWSIYFLLAEYYSRPYKRIFIKFQDILDDCKTQIQRLIQELNLNFINYEIILEDIKSFLDNKLKHYNIDIQSLTEPLPLNLRELIAVSQNPFNCNKDSIDRMRNDFFKQLDFFHTKEIRKGYFYQQKYENMYAQLFINCGMGFREEDSIIIKRGYERNFLDFDVSQFDKIYELRFDPLNAPVIVKLYEVNLILKNNEILKVKFDRLNSTYVENNIDYFLHDDPSYFIEIPKNHLNAIQGVIIKLDYIKVELNGLIKEIDLVVNDLKNKNHLLQNQILKKQYIKRIVKKIFGS